MAGALERFPPKRNRFGEQEARQDIARFPPKRNAFGFSVRLDSRRAGKALDWAPAEVEAHCLALDVDGEAQASLLSLLDPEEGRRAAAFRHPADRRRFIVRRGRLRELLALRLGCAPAEVTLSHNAYGKPFVAGAAFGFSVSHSLDTAMIVFAPGAEIGCDIEWRRPPLATQQVAERFFSPVEVERLGAVGPSQWIEAFFNCWTRKEALIKALGQGLSYPLKTFDVSLAPGEPAALLRGPPGWTLHAGPTRAGLHAALAVSEGARA